jgi:hypothetical protein
MFKAELLEEECGSQIDDKLPNEKEDLVQQ